LQRTSRIERSGRIFIYAYVDVIHEKRTQAPGDNQVFKSDGDKSLQNVMKTGTISILAKCYTYIVAFVGLQGLGRFTFAVPREKTHDSKIQNHHRDQQAQ